MISNLPTLSHYSIQGNVGQAAAGRRNVPDVGESIKELQQQKDAAIEES
jgi:hypothetical protein